LRAFLTYGPGIPRYVALWLPLAPLLLLALRSSGVPWTSVAVVVASTLPTFLRHNPPTAVPHVLLWLAMIALLAGIAGWLVTVLRRPAGDAPPSEPAAGVRWPAVGLLVLVALAVRVPLAWIDPGISDIPQASETAARQLLAGQNPYLQPNPYTIVGEYQYPAGSVLAHLPFVAAVPVEAFGERWLGARAAIWTTEALAVVVLALAGARLGRPRAGLGAGLAYALHPTLVREAGLTATNDLMVALGCLGCALLLAQGKPRWAAVALGVAISVKPAALVAVPVVAVAGGLRPAAISLAVPAVLQLPFWLWPTPGLHGLAAIAEPAGRLYEYGVLRGSLWWPLYAAVGPSPGLLRVITVVGVVVALLAAVWAGVRLRDQALPDPTTAAAAVGLPLLVTFALASDWRLTFQGWYLPCLLAAALMSPPVPGARRAPLAAHPPGAG